MKCPPCPKCGRGCWHPGRGPEHLATAPTAHFHPAKPLGHRWTGEPLEG